MTVSVEPEYKQVEEAWKKVRENLKWTREQAGRVYPGTFEDLDAIVAHFEARELQIKRMVEFMQSGGAESLGAAMESDFSRLRRLGE